MSVTRMFKALCFGLFMPVCELINPLSSHQLSYGRVSGPCFLIPASRLSIDPFRNFSRMFLNLESGVKNCGRESLSF